MAFKSKLKLLDSNLRLFSFLFSETMFLKMVASGPFKFSFFTYYVQSFQLQTLHQQCINMVAELL